MVCAAMRRPGKQAWWRQQDLRTSQPGSEELLASGGAQQDALGRPIIARRHHHAQPPTLQRMYVGACQADVYTLATATRPLASIPPASWAAGTAGNTSCLDMLLRRQSPRHKTAAMHRQALHTQPPSMQSTGPLMCSLTVEP